MDLVSTQHDITHSAIVAPLPVASWGGHCRGHADPAQATAAAHFATTAPLPVASSGALQGTRRARVGRRLLPVKGLQHRHVTRSGEHAMQQSMVTTR